MDSAWTIPISGCLSISSLILSRAAICSTDFSVDAHGVTMFGRLAPGLMRGAAENELRRSPRCCASSIRTTFGKTKIFPVLRADTRRMWAGGRHGTGTEQSDEGLSVDGVWWVA